MGGRKFSSRAALCKLLYEAWLRGGVFPLCILAMADNWGGIWIISGLVVEDAKIE